jgi:DNA-binding transcriptional ArsR family regulator
MTLNTEEAAVEKTLPTGLEAHLAAVESSPQLEKMFGNARRASDFLKALAHETRLLLLCLLSERERSVTELEQILSLRQPTVSQQLARLRLDGLVTTRRDGKTIYYRINDDDIRRVISVVYDIFCREGKEKQRRP